MRNDQIRTRQMVAHGHYTNSAKRQIKFPAIIRGIFGMFCGISEFLYIYSMVSGGTTNDVLWNPGWETLLLRDNLEPTNCEEQNSSGAIRLA